MHRIDGAGHVDHLFVAEDPATLRPPTEITPEIMNAFQEELATFIEWAGIVLAKGDNTQLKQALVVKFAGIDAAATKAGVQGQTYTAFTTAGVTGAFTLTPVPAIAAYAAGQRFRVKFHAAGNGADTMNVSGLGVKNIKQYDNAGTKVAAVIADSQLADVEYDGVDLIILDQLPPKASKQLQPIAASVAANALTLTLNPTSLDFRSVTVGSGAVNTRTINAAISLVVPSGATLNTVSGQQSRLVVIAIDNAGTVELAVANINYSGSLDETGLMTTTAISGASSNNGPFSTTARANVPYRVVGFVESTQAAAGSWATAPSTIQGIGGQALAAMSSIGYGQSWQAVTRSLGTTYYNTTGKPIFASYQATYNLNSAASWTVGGVSGVGYTSNAQTNPQALSSWAMIPPGSSYSFSISSGTVTGLTAMEFR